MPTGIQTRSAIDHSQIDGTVSTTEAVVGALAAGTQPPADLFPRDLVPRPGGGVELGDGLGRGKHGRVEVGQAEQVIVAGDQRFGAGAAGQGDEVVVVGVPAHRYYSWVVAERGFGQDLAEPGESVSVEAGGDPLTGEDVVELGDQMLGDHQHQPAGAGGVDEAPRGAIWVEGSRYQHAGVDNRPHSPRRTA